MPELEAVFAEHQKLLQAGAAYSACVRLGEIVNCVRHNLCSTRESEAWMARVAAADLSVGDIATISQDLQSSLDRIDHILGVASEWQYEEILLIVTLRIEASMAMEFLLARGIDVSSIDMSVADEAMEAYASKSDGLRLICEASRTVKRNWGIPLSHRWLEL